MFSRTKTVFFGQGGRHGFYQTAFGWYILYSKGPILMGMILYVGWFLASLVVGYMGSRRKFGFWGYFFGSILLSPLVGLLLVLASDKRPLPDSVK